MATRIELNQALVATAIRTHVGTLKRRLNTESNSLIKDIVQKELTQYEAAAATISEIK